MQKSIEEILREEVRFYAKMGQRNMQWGVTLMISLQTALFFARQDLIRNGVVVLTASGGHEVPAYRYLMGTTFLAVCAFVVSKFSSRTANQYRHYKNQLVSSDGSGIKDQPPSGVSGWAHWLYFAFPVFDVLGRLWVDLQIHISF